MYGCGTFTLSYTTRCLLILVKAATTYNWWVWHSCSCTSIIRCTRSQVKYWTKTFEGAADSLSVRSVYHPDKLINYNAGTLLQSREPTQRFTRSLSYPSLYDALTSSSTSITSIWNRDLLEINVENGDEIDYRCADLLLFVGVYNIVNLSWDCAKICSQRSLYAH